MTRKALGTWANAAAAASKEVAIPSVSQLVARARVDQYNVPPLMLLSADSAHRLSKAVNTAKCTGHTPPEATFGVNLAGGEFGSLYGIYGQDYVYPPAQELDYYKSKGCYVIRLPFRWERLQRTPSGPLDLTEMGRIDAVLANACSRGMKVVLDAHNYGRYKIDGTNEQIIGTPAIPNSAFANFWRRIAERYKDEQAIYGYGLMNEPHDMGDDARWPAAAQAAVDAIRTVNTTHTVIVA